LRIAATPTGSTAFCSLSALASASISSTNQGEISALKVLHGDTSIAHDLPEQASTEIAFAVNRDGDPTAIGMAKDRVTTALSDSTWSAVTMGRCELKP